MKTYGQIAYESYEISRWGPIILDEYKNLPLGITEAWEKAAEAVIDAFLACSVAPQEGYNNETSPQENPVRTTATDS